MEVNNNPVLVSIFQIVNLKVNVRKHVNMSSVNISQKRIFSARERGRGVQRDHFSDSNPPPLWLNSSMYFVIR